MLYIGSIRKCDQGHIMVPLPAFMQSLKGMHAYVIYYVSSQRSRWWAPNDLLHELNPRKLIKGDVLVMKMDSTERISDMTPLDSEEVDELLVRYSDPVSLGSCVDAIL